MTSLGAAWVIIKTAGFRYAVSFAVVAYVVFRILILIVLGVPGWIGPDIPLALFGLVLLDLPRSANHWRWPLAIGAVSSFQVAASLTGVSSVDPARFCVQRSCRQ